MYSKLIKEQLKRKPKKKGKELNMATNQEYFARMTTSVKETHVK